MMSSQKDNFCYEVIAPVPFLSFICECKMLINIKNVFYRRDQQRAAEGSNVMYMGYKTQSTTITRSDEDTFKAGHFFIFIK